MYIIQSRIQWANEGFDKGRRFLFRHVVNLLVMFHIRRKLEVIQNVIRDKVY